MARRRRRSSSARPPRVELPWDEVYPTLDLHGETADGARRRTEHWLREQQADSVRVVRVITGRGRRSIGPPVLRGEILDLLRSLRGSVVNEVTAEPGGGSFRVQLRRPRKPRRAPVARSSPPSPPKPSDPELRRQAEESLIELGITPTPLLIKAEMRRLRAEADREPL